MSDRQPFGGADGVLAFAPDTLEARAFAVMHAHDDGKMCPMCLLAWIARVAGEPGATGASVLQALGGVVYREHGGMLSIAFETLAYGEHGSGWAAGEGFRARFEALEKALQAKRLSELPAQPPPRAH